MNAPVKVWRAEAWRGPHPHQKEQWDEFMRTLNDDLTVFAKHMSRAPIDLSVRYDPHINRLEFMARFDVNGELLAVAVYEPYQMFAQVDFRRYDEEMNSVVARLGAYAQRIIAAERQEIAQCSPHHSQRA